MESNESGLADPEHGDAELPSPTSNRLPPRVILLAGLLVFILIAGLMYLIVDQRRSNQSGTEIGKSTVSELLAWIPATDATTRAFAVWTSDDRLPGDQGVAALQNKLAIDPSPLTLGHSPEWEADFGWQVGQVTGWAVAGLGAEISVLEGAFDQELIEQSLLDAGYQRSVERGVTLFSIDVPVLLVNSSGLDSPDHAIAVALYEGRIITATSIELMTAAIDSVLDGTGSLTQRTAIAAALQSISPVTAMTGIDFAYHAAGCLPGMIPAETANASANYVIVGYGRNGDEGELRTQIAVTFPDEAAASAHFVEFENGWFEGFANTGGAGGNVDAFGTLSGVSQTGSLLITELVDGRDDGWVRTGIRYAIPVCDVTLELAPPVATDPSGAQAGMTTAERLIASLPLIEPGSIQVVIDLESLSEDHGIVRPEMDASTEELTAWVSALGDLPGLSSFPLRPTFLTQWMTYFELPLSSIRGVGESVVVDSRAPVGVLIGNWERDRVTAHLSAIGYDWIDLGDVRHFAYVGGNPAEALPGVAFRNIALFGDRMWFSDDQQLMRDMIEAAINE